VNLPADFVRLLKANIGEDAYSNWFDSVDFSLPDDHTILLHVPTRFAGDYIVANFGAIVLGCCKSAGVQAHKVRTRVRRDTGKRSDLKRLHPPGSRNEDGLDARFSFERFVVGEANRAAHAAAMHMSESKRSQGGLLHLYGATGVGKTHLMMAAGQKIRVRWPDADIRFMTAELFTTEFVTSSRIRKLQELRRRIRALDVLLIDDIQFFAGKTKTTEELELTIDALIGAGKIMILACNAHIDDIGPFGPRLRSRIQHGLVSRIEMPDADLKRQILKAKLLELQKTSPNLSLEDGVATFISDNIGGDIRHIEGAIGRLDAASSYLPLPISQHHATHLLMDLLNIQRVQPKIDDIVKAVASYFGLKPADIVSKNRAANIARARQIGIFLANEMTPHSVSQIGKHFARDHTTVNYSINKIKGLCNSRQNVVNDIDAIRKGITLPQ